MLSGARDRSLEPRSALRIPRIRLSSLRGASGSARRTRSTTRAVVEDATVRTLLAGSLLFLVSFDLTWGWYALYLVPITALQHGLAPLAKRGALGEALSFSVVFVGAGLSIVFTALHGAYVSRLAVTLDPEAAANAALEAALALVATERVGSFPPGLWVFLVSFGTAAAVGRQIGRWSWQLVYFAPLTPLLFGRADDGAALGALVFAAAATGAFLLVCWIGDVIVGTSDAPEGSEPLGDRRVPAD